MKSRNIYLVILFILNVLFIYYIVNTWNTDTLFLSWNIPLVMGLVLVFLWLSDGVQYTHFISEKVNYKFSFIAVVSDVLILLLGMSIVIVPFIIVNFINTFLIGEDRSQKNKFKSIANQYIFFIINIKAFSIIFFFQLFGGGFGTDFKLIYLPYFILSIILTTMIELLINFAFIKVRSKQSIKSSIRPFLTIEGTVLVVSILDTIVIFLLVHYLHLTFADLINTGTLTINFYLYLFVQILAIYIGYLTLTHFDFVRNSRSLSFLRKVVTNSLLLSLGMKDTYTLHHSERVSKYAVLLGRVMGYKEGRLLDLEVAGLLHDIGKLNISDDIINNPGKLSEDQWDEVKTHPAKSLDVLKQIVERNDYSLDSLDLVFNIALHHHEQYNGSGYPNGLAEGAIPFEARLITVVDAFDAMTHKRIYVIEKSIDEAIKELREFKGVQFDPEIVDIFTSFISQFKSVDDILKNYRPPAFEKIVYRQRYFSNYQNIFEK